MSLGPYKTYERSKFMGHVHGQLRFEINGQIIDWFLVDACFNTWLPNLNFILRHFEGGETSYRKEGDDQGEPDFLFEREGNHVYFSILGNEEFAESGDPDWQKAKFDFGDFKTAVLNVTDQFLADVAAKAPEQLDQWKALINPDLSKWFPKQG
jgi:hypothetical protein